MITDGYPTIEMGKSSNIDYTGGFITGWDSTNVDITGDYDLNHSGSLYTMIAIRKGSDTDFGVFGFTDGNGGNYGPACDNPVECCMAWNKYASTTFAGGFHCDSHGEGDDETLFHDDSVITADFIEDLSGPAAKIQFGAGFTADYKTYCVAFSTKSNVCGSNRYLGDVTADSQSIDSNCNPRLAFVKGESASRPAFMRWHDGTNGHDSGKSYQCQRPAGGADALLSDRIGNFSKGSIAMGADTDIDASSEYFNLFWLGEAVAAAGSLVTCNRGDMRALLAR
jgi:hypothetical protein